MAQDSIVGGLFGLTPEMYQRSQQAEDQKEAMQFAQLSPFQQASAGFYSAGRGLGRGIGTLLGAEDPQLQMIAQQQQILRNVDQNDPESIAAGARMAAEMGNPRLAAALGDLQRKTLESKALVAQRVASATRERTTSIPTSIQEAQYISALKSNLQRFNDLPEETEGRAEEISRIKAELSALEKPEKTLSFGQEAERVSLEMYGKSFSQLTQAEMKAVNDRVKKKSTGQEIGEGMATGFGLLGRALAPALKKEGEETGKFSAENYNKLALAVSSGISSKRNLDLLTEVLPKAFTGSFADFKTQAIKAVDGLGIPVKDDLKNAASSSELLTAMATRYLFPLVKQFPGSLAVKELNVLQAASPNIQQQPESIARLINAMRIDISENEYVYNNAKDYRSKKGSLINFSEGDAKIEFQKKLNRLRSLYDNVKSSGGRGTKEEGEEINSLKRELGVK